MIGRFYMSSIKVMGYSMYCRDENNSETALLFLHGIPVDHTLWDGVIGAMKSEFRVVAPDFLGFGKSDKPLDIEYNLETYTKMVEELVEELRLESFVIVAMDLGLMVGLNYWVKHPSRVKGLVLFEGLLAGLDVALSSQSFFNRVAMNLMRKETIAGKAFVDQGVQTTKNMIEKGTIRKMPEAENLVKQFTDPKLCEKILLHGVCAHTISNSRKTGELADAAKQYFRALCESDIPKMILYAKPGAAVSAKFVRKFKPRLKNCLWIFVGNGKHYLPFDQPEAIAQAIDRMICEK